MFSKVWSIGIQKNTKMIHHHVHIGSTDQFNQVGVHEKNDRNAINSMDVHHVCLCICITFSSLIRKVSGLPADLNSFFICFLKTMKLMSIFQTFVWNIDINFIVFKKQIKNIFWNIGINFVVNKN